MRVQGTAVLRSATDLSNFLSCRHRSGLDLAVARGALEAPRFTDPLLDLLRELGDRHERRFVDGLRAQGLRIEDATRRPDGSRRSNEESADETLRAMHAGVDGIVQARLTGGGWGGFADVLRRVDRPSGLGPWSYEVWDTKLARDTRAGSVLQLAVYCDLLAAIQAAWPEHLHVVTPDAASPVRTYRVADVMAYYRLVKRSMDVAVAMGHDAVQAAHYPEPVEGCESCRWAQRCEQRRRADDHLSFVAGLSRLQRDELAAHGITTLAGLADLPLPLRFRPSRGSASGFERIREQARLQVQQRTSGRPVYELLPLEPDQGLARLPEPSDGDLVLDLEGASFAREGGREYLFGIGWHERETFRYRCWWARTDAEERAAFEALMDHVLDAWASDPAMHVYHFGHYEPDALKRLMGRHATREDAVDRLLRGGRLVDLHAVVRRGLRAGVESYSIKKLEPFYAFRRDVPLQAAAPHLQFVERALALDALDLVSPDVRAAIEGYNRDDCRSTRALRDWLEDRRAEWESGGVAVSRPAPKPDEAPEKVSGIQTRVDACRNQLLDGVPGDPAARSGAQQARWILANLLDWHRREDKVRWWEYYRLRELPEEDLLDERAALAGLTHAGRVEETVDRRGRRTGSVVDRYAFPEQEFEIEAQDSLKTQDGRRFGEVVSVDRDGRTIDVKKGRSRDADHPTAVFEHRSFSPDAMQAALLDLGEQVAAAGDVQATRGCALDLLLRRPPRVRTGAFEPVAIEIASDFAVRIAGDLDGSTLAIQGPPGAGKTYTGARMIRALVRAGRQVGVTAVSHAVIRNLLEEVRDQAARAGEIVRLAHKDRSDSRPPGMRDGILSIGSNRDGLEQLASRSTDVLGGTVWLWADEDLRAQLDVLFVDEAGQMSLANVLAASRAASNLVLLGDPQQLEQPQRGSHPDGTDVSALEHVLGAAKTMPDTHGIFLPQTWRLAPPICGFTSELFYEGRLAPRAGLERQRLASTPSAGPLEGAGLWWVPVAHDGNQNWSAEEVGAVTRLVDALLAPNTTWTDAGGVAHALRPEDILVVAPYNAHVNRLGAVLRPRGLRVGTVDKFQGQEAPVVIYSMATSRPEDAPRGMEFLYSLNRLNVATSRARCAVFLVASPFLLEPACRTPRQIQLANALCRYRELAREIDLGARSFTG